MYFVYRDGALHRRGRASRSATSWPAACRNCAGEAATIGRFRRPRDHRLHRCAAEAVPGDARRRCRPAGHDGGAIGVLGRAAVRRRGPGRGRGAGAPADAGGIRSRCARRCRVRGSMRGSRRQERVAICARLAREALAVARDGLRARRRLDASGRDEAIHLAPLEEIIGGGPTQAEYWLGKYHGEWRGDVQSHLRRGGHLASGGNDVSWYEACRRTCLCNRVPTI